MLRGPSLRRRLILSYLVVVAAVIGAAFFTVQILVPQFFEQAVQERLGPGPQNGQDQGEVDSPGQGPGPNRDGRQTTTTAPETTPGTQTTQTPASTTTTTTRGSGPTGSTIGPGASTTVPGTGNGSGGPGEGQGPGGGDRGRATSTTTDALGSIPGVLAAPLAQETERSPVPVEIQQDYDRALSNALVVAAAVGLAIALGLGWLLTRRLLRTFTGIKEGASKLADGHYDVRIPVPAEVELADLAESVNTLADSLQRTEQTRARLVSDLAHEIRNPLSTIEGYMEGLIDGVLPASQETYAAVAAEAHRLQRLTRDLSTLSKAQEGAIEYEYAPVDLGAVVNRVAGTLRPQYEINNVTLDVTIAGPMPVRMDADRIAQALTNLLGNALGHTPEHGRVTVTGDSDDRWCVVTVIDTGDGIPESALDTIFERFTRLDATRSGTGIGLNIARVVARAHGGDITAASDGPGAGSTFTFRLPRLRS